MKELFKMKNLLAASMAVVMCLSFAGCSEKGADSGADKASTQTETNKTDKKAKGKFRELPKFELSDNWEDDTFSIDGKVFKFGETAVQDLIQCGLEIDCEEEKVPAGENLSFKIVLPSNETGDNLGFYATAVSKEDLDLMDERLKVTGFWLETDDLANSVLPKISCANFVVNDFTTLEDAVAVLGATEIDDVGSGNRQIMYSGGGNYNTALRIKQTFSETKIGIELQYDIEGYRLEVKE